MRKTTLTLAVLAVAGLTAGAALAQPPQQTPEQRQAAFKAADQAFAAATKAARQDLQAAFKNTNI